MCTMLGNPPPPPDAKRLELLRHRYRMSVGGGGRKFVIRNLRFGLQSTAFRDFFIIGFHSKTVSFFERLPCLILFVHHTITVAAKRTPEVKLVEVCAFNNVFLDISEDCHGFTKLGAPAILGQSL